MELKKIDINKLVHADYNPRKDLTPKDKEYQKILKSINEFGYVDPLIINKDYTIIAGHQRAKVLKDIGLEQIDVIFVDISKEKEKALNIALNKISGEWDFEKLTELLKEIKEENLDDFFLTGFEENELDKLVKNFDKSEKGSSKADDFNSEDSLKEIVNPVSKQGDLIQLGRHYLYCGDATIEIQVKKLLNGVIPILMVTDPPYGVKYEPEWRDKAFFHVGQRSKGKVENDDIIDWTKAYNLFPGQVAYVWHAGKHTHIVAKNLEDCNFELISQIIWAKHHFAVSMGDIHWQHEPCWYCCKKGNNHNWQGARDVSTLWSIKNNNAFGNNDREERWGHGTQKPVECMLRPIKNNSSPGQAIYDPFGGSGTSLIAAEESGRVCYMMEINPAYCDIIVKRYIHYKDGNSEDVFLIEGEKRTPWSEISKYEPARKK